MGVQMRAPIYTKYFQGDKIMQQKAVKTILIGAGQRGSAYCDYAKSHPDKLRIVGVADADPIRKNQFKEKFDLPEADCLDTWEDVFKREKWADTVFICTQDEMHYAPVMAAIEAGYDILLEKPISPSPKECMEMARAAEAKGVKVVVCHVLRYTPFFAKIKEIIDSGEIGDVVTIVHNENVGNLHHSHSFVRGNWGNSETSSPMILAKSCHDLDVVQGLVGKDCLRLSSFGSLSYFNKDNCPEGAPPRCTDGCTEDCPYDSRKLYISSDNEWFRSVAAGRYNATNEELEAAMKAGPYGRCVFQCDNNVVDHQVVSMEFEDGVTVIFSMSSFTPDISRSIKVMGTKGQIKGYTTEKSIKVSNFVTNEEREMIIESKSGHDGGDTGIMDTFCEYVKGGAPGKAITDIGISAKNHMLCFAAEKSRLENGVIIEMDAFAKDF